MMLVVALSMLLVATAAADSRLDALEADAATARENMQGYIKQGRTMESRLHRLEDTECDSHRQFQCGGFERRCLSDLLVCDGHADCVDGGDECADMCRSRVPIGAVFDGDISRHAQGGCGADVVHMRFTITFVQRNAWFQSRNKVKAAMTVTHKDGSTTSAIVRGYYNYSLHTVVLLPMGDDAPAKLGLSCQFDGVQDDRCLANVRKSNLGSCMTFGMRRIDDH